MPEANRAFASIQPVSNWQSRGHQGTKPIPNSSQSGITSFSESRVAIEYSFWIAVSGSAADSLDARFGEPPMQNLARTRL